MKMKKKCFTKQKTGRDKAQIMQDFRITLYINIILCIQLLFKEDKIQNNAKPLQTDS